MKTIINLIKYLFNPDWKVIHISKSTYKTWNSIKGIEYDIKNRTLICKLKYSKIRNKYKIIFEGYVPNEKFESSAYLECLQKQLNYEK